MATQIDRVIVEALKIELAALPRKEKPVPSSISKQEAIAEMRKEIADLIQKKNYTFEEVAAMLSGNGLEITSSTLRSYVQRSSSSKKPGAKKTASTQT